MPFFKRNRNQVDDEGFVLVGGSEMVVVDEIVSVEVAGEPVIVTRWAGQVIAFSAYCPHAAADLRDGGVRRGRVDCPEHDYRFDVVTGRAIWPPDEACRLKKYEVKESDGMVKVRSKQ
ncbi:MAG TPA: Rieske 2Fe-2S domain-containing protein [Anaerolineae bacterium]|nr:Rieske 2Fe-2S domain-containing protein [Anaerolineae bacterium]